MGTESIEVVKINALVSNHNSDQDIIDNNLVDELREDLTILMKKNKYKKSDIFICYGIDE